jgi:hypothetical protein
VQVSLEIWEEVFSQQMWMTCSSGSNPVHVNNNRLFRHFCHCQPAHLIIGVLIDKIADVSFTVKPAVDSTNLLLRENFRNNVFVSGVFLNHCI